MVAVSLREHDEDTLLEFAVRPAEGETARALWRADRAARDALHDELRQSARRVGAGLVTDPEPHRLAALWAAGAFQ